MILDFSVCPPATILEQVVMSACQTLHSSPNAAAYVIFPQQHSCIQPASVIANVRRVEDRLLFHGACFELPDSAVHFEVQEAHAGDKRPLSARTKLVISERHSRDLCPWINSRAARGKVERVPLIKVKDMRCAPTALPSPDQRPSPSERVHQKGHEACEAIFECLLDGVLPSGTKSAVLIVDFLPCPAWSWGHASWSLWQKASLELNRPAIGHIAFEADEPTRKASVRCLQKVLMAEWWEHQAEAGPARLSEEVALPKPTLSCAAWNGNNAIVPDLVKQRFEGSDLQESWTDLCDTFGQKFGRSDLLPGAAPKPAAMGSAVVGPDLSVPPHAKPLQIISCPTLPRGDFPHETVPEPQTTLSASKHLEFNAIVSSSSPQASSIHCMCVRLIYCKPTKILPTVSITKNYQLWVSLDDTLHPAEGLSMTSCELFGFNTGDFQLVEAPDRQKQIAWQFQSDVQYFVLPSANGDQKVLTTFCNATFEALKEDSTPDLELKHHRCSPMFQMISGVQAEIFCRSNVAPAEKSVVFVPAALSDSCLASGIAKRGQLGAAFAGHLDVLGEGVVWEAALNMAPPASLNPVKPKFWLQGSLDMVHGVYYRLV